MCYVILQHFCYHQEHLKTKKIITYMSLLSTQLLNYISISNNGKRSICIKTCMNLSLCKATSKVADFYFYSIRTEEKSSYLPFQPLPFPAFDYSFCEVFQSNNQFHSTPPVKGPHFFNPPLNLLQRQPCKQGLVRLQN